MKVLLTGSIAFDYLMTFPGQFKQHILPEHLDRISLSFLVDKLVRRPGGIAANIAYTMALLGERVTIMATVGEDFDEQRSWLEEHGVDTSEIRTIPGEFTASFFVTTDQTNAQIASFFTGAMAYAADLSISEVSSAPDLVVISPNDPQAMVSYTHECRKMNTPYVYDPSQQIVRMEAASLRDGIEGCHVLFANDYEFNLIEEKTGWDLKAIRHFADLIVITRGENGSTIHRAEDEIHIPAVHPERIVDPTGVGDAFRGGFLKGYVHGLSVERCGQMGALAATYCLEVDGPQGHHFNIENFVARFREHFDDQGELDALM